MPLGEAAALEGIERWLTAYEADVTVCRDVYDFCALLARSTEAPDLALIGTDWLRAEDLRVFDFARTTWPRTVLLAYGAGCDDVPDDPADLQLVYSTPRALSAALLESPATLVDRQRRGAVRPPSAGRRSLRATSVPSSIGVPAPPSRLTDDDATTARWMRSNQPRAEWMRLLDDNEF